MKLRTFFLSVIVFSIIIFACSPDDPDVSLVPDRDRAEQQIADKDSITAYLNTHYYNSGDLANLTNPSVTDIVITKLEDNDILPDNTMLLADAIETRTTTFEDTEYEYYILKINQGGGENSPRFSDRISTIYEGSLVDDGSVFDSNLSIGDPLVVDLVPNPFLPSVNGDILNGAITGWQRVFPEFNPNENFTIGSDGVANYNNFGLGVMFLPSGLGYFSRAQVGIPSYSNLVFKFTLFQVEESDHDNDGIPSYIEDLNNNLDTLDDDTDEDGLFNYLDSDDDGDGVLTIFEDLEPDSDLTVDRDGDGDPTNDIGDGDPTNDDSDNDGIPNYLDSDSTESNQDS